jgi:hypothetical protein
MDGGLRVSIPPDELFSTSEFFPTKGFSNLVLLGVFDREI